MSQIKLYGLLLSLFWVLSSPLTAHSVIVPLTSTSEDGVLDLLEGAGKDAILECVEGSYLPLRLFIRGDILQVEEGAPLVMLRVQQTFYIKVEEESFFFSKDAVDWLPLLDFVTGFASLGLGTEDGHSVAEAGVELYLNN